MTAKVLVVEDEAALAEMLQYNLSAEGFEVTVVDDGDEVEMHLAEQTPDIILLDWMLPGVSGIEICRRLRAREAFNGIPIIMLTAKGEEADRVRGFATGADDYVVKPFSIAELMGRVRAVLRRMNPERVADTLTVHGITMDRTAHKVTRNGRKVRLGPTEYKLLEFFLENADRVLTRSQLLDGVWGNDVFVDERTVDVHIGRLRKAVIRGKEADPISTVRGVGYALWKTVTEEAG